MKDTIRIMTWNVHGTFNLNPHFNLDGVCAIIEKWAPDVVALQEVDSRGRSDDVFGRLADSVGEHRVEARSIIAEDGHYGQVLLSRWPRRNRRLPTCPIRSGNRAGPSLPASAFPSAR
jgi:endonuclease/exonuclease/phosphatase family metal-dependent hydrolase